MKLLSTGTGGSSDEVEKESITLGTCSRDDAERKSIAVRRHKAVAEQLRAGRGQCVQRQRTVFAATEDSVHQRFVPWLGLTDFPLPLFSDTF